MAKLLSPFHLFSLPIILVVSIPLATFAVFTTGIALSTLLIRVSIVYLELGVALVHSWLFVSDSTSKSHRGSPTNPSSPIRSSPPRNSRRRRSSLASVSSFEYIQQHQQQQQQQGQASGGPYLSHRKSGSSTSLVFASVPNRDFEGVGGWRATGNGQEEALWMGMNSRLELPSSLGERQRRHHRRTLTGGSAGTPEMIRISPMQSRARTPPFGASEGSSSPVEYFSLQPYGRPAVLLDNDARKEEARKSLSGSSISSTSSRSSRNTLRQLGYV